jgi:hypothetical protein
MAQTYTVARAEWLRVQGTIPADNFDPMLHAIVPAGSLLLANAVSALGTAAAALARRIGLLAHRHGRSSR